MYLYGSPMQDDALAWYNLIFYIPLVIGLLLVIGVATGIADLPQGVDLDGDGVPDVWVDADGDADDAVGNIGPLSFLGFGRAPFMLVVMVMALTFGGSGVVLCQVLGVGPMRAVLAVSFALAFTAVMTRAFTRLVSKLLPTMETASTTNADLIGHTGTLIMEADPFSGFAQVQKDGDVYNIKVRVVGDHVLAKGTSILVTRYDDELQAYDVCANPLGNG